MAIEQPEGEKEAAAAASSGIIVTKKEISTDN
jgi:hypothetical protein